MKCFYCEKTRDLRPYGPKGSMVCFKCAMSSHERKEETEKNFYSQMIACGDVAVLNGTSTGPYPIKNKN